MTVYYSYSGQPYLVMDYEDLKKLPSQVTQIKPPEGIYAPYYFDENQGVWIGSSKQEFEEKLPKEISVNNEFLISQLAIKVATQENQISQLKAIIGDLTLEVAQLKGGASG
ncbi:inositol-3-phosphate synthase [Staphylococcus agnetis]|uniref:inositol-3-phosphate synthase n=1 Tax=Staphylococcus agnetis TaxID=985762 RepID=UPI0021D34546|nr:inositol-3-phosphate synthase [Staphylococcus agnetis]UXU67486.1 inositol-3-phosphate synthase [Staphylococcus agnetis]